ncbi:MAG: 6-carboxytetrahydropterin synthase [Planctomycetota bacterium]|nr:MAG: 6-carboxytetrahydropterin synthase [Planctomycetota bacterium]
MHYLTRGFTFSASHRLHNPQMSGEDNACAFGMCENVHGHNYRMEITVRGELDAQRGFFCNVMDLKQVVDELVADPCEHQFLNDIPLFEGVVPTTMENLSQRIWQVLEPALAARSMELYEVLLAETPDNIVRLRKD